MKIWVDILTPKQLLFFEPINEKLSKNHQVLCTSRKYGDVSKLVTIRKFKINFIGKHGGMKKNSKLDSSINRMKKLSPKIQKFSPDLAISFCSPEAARIAFGLGIKHVAFCDSPHATAVMKLCIPLIQKLLIPWIIPKKEFTRYGIKNNDIIQYKTIDAAITIKNPPKQSKPLPISKNKKNIIIRVEEDQASYITNHDKKIPIIKQIVADHGNENIVVLSRYSNQTKKLKEKFGKNVKIIDMSFEGVELLKKADIFIGSGGTMTAESALIGIPTISYNAVPNLIEKFLVNRKLVIRETNPKKISQLIKKFPIKNRANKVKEIQNLMQDQDPYKKLLPLLKK